MKYLVTLLVATGIACVHAQGGRTLPADIVRETKNALKSAPDTTTVQKVQYAINYPFENVADAVSYFDPAFAPVFQRYAGFDIPLNRRVFSSLMRSALSQGKLDKLNIISIIIASIKIPPAGDLKKIGLYLVKEFLCIIVNSGLLPGLENEIPFIMQSVKENNQLSNGLTKSVVNGIGDLPVVGGFLKNLGKTLTGGISGLPEVIRVYADDPSRAINALLKYVNRQGPIGTTCPRRRTLPLQPVSIQPTPIISSPINFGPGPVILPNA